MSVGGFEKEYMQRRPDKKEFNLMMQIFHVNYKEGDHLLPGQFPRLIKLVKRMLNRDPELRPSHAEIIEYVSDLALDKNK